MIIRNVKIFTVEKKFVPGTVITEKDRIVEVILEGREDACGCCDATEADAGGENAGGQEIIDGQGCYCFPGMIDLHFHGCKGYDACDGTREALEAIAEYEASIGVTSICPATMTLPVEELEQVLGQAAALHREQMSGVTSDGASLVGLNMEGPFISRLKKGAQDERNIIPCDVDIYRRFQKAADGLVRLIGIAPEENDAEAVESFIRAVSKEAVVSLAHTNADYETAKHAFDAGASHAVHLYNAMSPFTHREPGVAGAVFDSSHVTAELICDGIHVHPAVVRMTFSLLGADRVIMISDSMRATGMPDGQYTLGGLDVTVHGKYATLTSDGVLAGSVTSLPDCVRTAVLQMGIPLETAIAAATVNPAKKLGILEDRGTLEAGKRADIVLWNEDLSLAAVIRNGRLQGQ
jgi:N-acetylglucosamine-6-phosphate deacetylase